jgi:hypothetical protein
MSNTVTLHPRSEPVQLHGQISLDVNEVAVQSWRLPCDTLDLFHADLARRAACAAGVRVDLISDSSTLAMDFAVGGEAERSRRSQAALR